MDQWVKNVQEWLNDTYGNDPAIDINPVNEDGETGWQTVNALTRALQYELGLTALADNFGPGTLAALEAKGPIDDDTTPKNIIRIAQAGLYCKGYNGGTLDADWGSIARASTQQLRTDMGLAPESGFVHPKIFKAILNMDAFVLVAGGSSLIRQIQQNLNDRYLSRENFFVIPTDGFFSRSVQNALIYALQYEIGMSDSVANGNFGPGTQQGIRDHAALQLGTTDSTKYFVHLFQAAMTFNGYPVAFDGDYGNQTRSAVIDFQSFAKLSVTGNADFQTWASLLVSTGDTSRPGTAVDCITTITPARAQTLISHGYEAVGRYLTNTPGGSLDKNIKPGELQTIFDASLTVFPIYQEGGTGTAFFNYSMGVAAAKRAHAAARGYGFKPGTVIYFAVDFDVLGEQIFSNIVPHFEGIRDGLGSVGSAYRVGIYGARNVCTQVSERGLAVNSFVSGMSTGFSGNLGYPLPRNWAFDQILEYAIGTGDGYIGIDKDIKSGRDQGQSSIDATPPAPSLNSEFVDFLYWLQIQANEYRAANAGSPSAAELVAQFMRSPKYQGLDWTALAGPRFTNWVTFVYDQALAEGVTLRSLYVLPEVSAEPVSSDHFFATLNAYLHRGIPSRVDGPEFTDIAGWGGDLATTLVDFTNSQNIGESIGNFGRRVIGGTGNNSLSFGQLDLIQDVDAVNVAAAYLANPAPSLAGIVRDALAGGVVPNENRYQTFVRERFGNVANAKMAGRQAFLQNADTNDKLLFNGARTYLIQAYGSPGDPVHIGDFSVAQLEELGDAFGTVLDQLGA
ncbi:hypothetical protein GCM10027416_13860 [Okibacterium endophyticum]